MSVLWCDLSLIQEIGLCPVTLKNPNYYTEPRAKDLHLDENGNCWVDDFVVGHRTHGSAHFPGRTNVTGLDLDSVGMTNVAVYTFITW